MNSANLVREGDTNPAQEDRGEVKGDSDSSDNEEEVPALENIPKQEPPPEPINYSYPVWISYRRYGHLSWREIYKLEKNSIGIGVTTAQIKAMYRAICPVCAITKATINIPRAPATRDFSKPGDLMIIDMWGPYKDKALDGTIGFLLMTD